LPDDEVERIINAMLIGLAVLFLGVIASIIVGRKVSSPVKAIGVAPDMVDKGHLDSLSVLGRSHIRELVDANMAMNHSMTGIRFQPSHKEYSPASQLVIPTIVVVTLIIRDNTALGGTQSMYDCNVGIFSVCYRHKLR
jgi:hypothetical protein